MVISCSGQSKQNGPKENTTISPGQPKLVKTQASQQGDNVSGSLQDRKGNLWFATTSNGVYRYDGKSFNKFTMKDGLNSNAVFSILEDKKGNIWFGTNKGLSRYDGKTFTYLSLSPADGDNNPSAGNIVTSILEDKNGKFWFGTYNGVYCYDGNAFTRFSDDQNMVNSNGLTLKLVTSMLEDKNGNIWFNTRTEGVCRYDGKSLINYTPNGEIWFRGLLEDKNGNIWVGTRYKGVFRYDGKAFTNILQNGIFDSSTVPSIMQDKSGNIWFGTEAGDESKRETEGGVWVYNGISFTNFSTKDGLSDNGISSVLEDGDGNIWVGTRNTGLCRFDGKTFTSFSE